MKQSTIAAIATPAGEGGIGIVRISGPQAIRVADKVFSSASGKRLEQTKGYCALFGHVSFEEKTIDEAVALVFRAPRSYTGEDVVELSVHGGRYVQKQVLRAVLAAGATFAQGGEFTKRAFLNGKIDLSQAEAVAAIISASGEQALRAAVSAKSGKISECIESIKNSVLAAAASVAAYSDYPDEDEEFSGINTLSDRLSAAVCELDTLIKDYDNGRVIREGINTAIIGTPNVGKSTLMNYLSGHERSIVTEIAGTTRDTIEETVLLGDIKLNLCDTAGIRDTGDTVEKIGVDRAKQRIKTAELILAVFDASRELDPDDIKILESADPARTIVVLNKTDIKNLVTASDFDRFPLTVVSISAKNGKGGNEIKKAIENLININTISSEGVYLVSERQRECAVKAKRDLQEALDILQDGMTIDAVGTCIDDALATLMELTGQRVTVEVTDEVFKNFCVGK
ncbi:MAG: tRNA uridine-5-carboxymethylaminomethyl(34) synthesis GTPase MnmE [bacterium]|nr:tRNA uridine-5-carboxymethylaminomethyl(34) synthesis GTPase MnmE [bacterium]